MSTVLSFPKKRSGPVKVYLAGKMELGGWRSEVVPGVELGINGLGADDTWPALPFTLDGTPAEYVGPYWLACSHSCFGGRSQHGFGVHQEEHENCGWLPSVQVPEDAAGRRRYVVECCARAIREADLVFAWVDDLTAFGTLVEIGLARGMPGKMVAIASPERMLDVWFAYEMADSVTTSFSPVEALSRVLKHYPARLPETSVVPSLERAWT